MAGGCAPVSLVVEGEVDAAVLQRLCAHSGLHVRSVHGRQGKDHIRKRIRSYAAAAQRSCWIVLVDLDQEESCAARLKRSWLPSPAPRLSLRVAVREVEAWLLADSERIAAFLGVSESAVPRNVDELPDPKAAVVALAARSRRRDLRRDMMPRPGSGRDVGPAYVSRLVEFTHPGSRGWRPEMAAKQSDSLHRCLRDLEWRAQEHP